MDLKLTLKKERKKGVYSEFQFFAGQVDLRVRRYYSVHVDISDNFYSTIFRTKQSVWPYRLGMALKAMETMKTTCSEDAA